MPTNSTFLEQKSNSISQKDEDISTENECTHESLFKQDNLANIFSTIGLVAGNIKGLANIPTSGKNGPYLNHKLKYGRIFIRERK